MPNQAPFESSCHVLLNRLRGLLPDVRGPRTEGIVTIRRPQSARVVTIARDGAAYWIATEDVSPTARAVDSDRHDVHAARTFARANTGGFDPTLTRSDETLQNS